MKSNRKLTVLVLVTACLVIASGMGKAFATTTTYDSVDVPKATVDAGTITSTITVPCDASITDVNVQINIDHSFLPVLDIFLISPGGTVIELFNGNGVFGGAGSFTDTIFDDEAEPHINDGSSPYAGSYRPEGSLMNVDGKSIGGTWTLQITDTDGFGDTGTLHSWNLTFDTYNGTIPSSDIPKAIPDPGVTTSLITTCSIGMNILDVNVQLDITHPWDDDLTLTLIAPDDTRVLLSQKRGGFAADYNETVFDDEAETSISDGAAPFSGSYRPEELLSVLDNMSVDGDWTLEVSDDAFAVAGVLHSWSLIFELVNEPYNASTYVSDIAGPVAGLTVDQTTRTFYYADYNCDGVLRKIAPNGTVSLITSDFTPLNPPATCTSGSNFYPYYSTDIQFLNGKVYVPLSDGDLAQIETATGAMSIEHTFAGFMEEGGIDTKKGLLLVSSGQGPATEIQSYNISSQKATTVLDVSPLPHVQNVEFDPAKGATYFWSAGNFYKADLEIGTYSAVSPYTTFKDDFEVSPDGNYLLTVNGQDLDRISMIDGSSVTVYSGLINNMMLSRHDMVFAPSSSAGGCSLYVVNGLNILEISGFVGRCKPFPWGMFLPAITQ